jgi:hypothetical protein
MFRLITLVLNIVIIFSPTTKLYELGAAIGFESNNHQYRYIRIIMIQTIYLYVYFAFFQGQVYIDVYICIYACSMYHYRKIRSFRFSCTSRIE